jgi:hypothetical protein
VSRRSVRGSAPNGPSDSSPLLPIVSMFHHRDSLLCLLDLRILDGKEDDDETASTVSCSESFSSSSGSVTFAEPLVTDGFIRPATPREEKARLFYCDRDYREFRKEYYMYGKREPRDAVVSFSDKIVTDVHEYAQVEDKSMLYYSESDLKRYASGRRLRRRRCEGVPASSASPWTR